MRHPFSFLMRANHFGFFVALACVWGCSDGNLPLYHELGGLRVLALQADPPEVSPGASVSMKAIISDLPSANGGAARTLSYSAVACLDPGVGLGADPSCEGRPDRVSVATDQAISELSGDQGVATNEITPFSVTVPATALVGRGSDESYNGVAYLVILTVRAISNNGVTETLQAFKRILVSEAGKSDLNSNPTISAVRTASGELFSTFLSALSFSAPATPVELIPEFGSGSAQTYFEKVNGTLITREEVLVTTWFYSDGSMKDTRSVGAKANRWTPPPQQPARPGVVLLMVTRDGRGGETFQRFVK